MSVLFMEGFDQYPNGGGGLGSRWNHGTPLTATSSASNIRTGGVRAGSHGVTTTTGGGALIAPAENVVIIAGVVGNFGGFSTISTLAVGATNAGAEEVTFRLYAGGFQECGLAIGQDGALILLRATTAASTGSAYTVVAKSAPGLVLIGSGLFPYVEVKFTRSDTGGCVVRLNGVQVWSVTGVDIMQNPTQSISTFALIRNCFWDDVVVLDTAGSVNNDFLGDVRVLYLPTDGVGATATATPVGAATLADCVDETGAVDNDTTYAQYATGNRVDWSLENLPGNVGQVHAVEPVGIIRKDDAGSNTVRVGLLSGATLAESADKGLTTAYDLVTGGIRQTDPATGAAWTIAGVNAVQRVTNRTV